MGPLHFIVQTEKKKKKNPSIYYLYQQRDNFQLYNETRNISHHKINKATCYLMLETEYKERFLV